MNKSASGYKMKVEKRIKIARVLNMAVTICTYILYFCGCYVFTCVSFAWKVNFSVKKWINISVVVGVIHQGCRQAETYLT